MEGVKHEEWVVTLIDGAFEAQEPERSEEGLEEGSEDGSKEGSEEGPKEGSDEELLNLRSPLLISTGFFKYPFRHSFQTGIKIQISTN